MYEKPTSLEELRTATYNILKAEYNAKSYPLWMIDRAINVWAQEICDWTLYNLKTDKRISKLNLRFAEENEIFEAANTSYLASPAVVGGTSLDIENPVVYNPSTGQYKWLQNKFDDVPELIGEPPTALTLWAGWAAQSFIAKRNKLKYVKFYKNVNGLGTGTQDPTTVTFSLRKSVAGVPDSQIITQYVYTWSQWQALPINQQFTVVLESELERGNTYWVVLEVDLTNPLNIPSLLATNSNLRPALYNTKYDFESFMEKKPIFGLIHNGNRWLNQNNSIQYTTALIELDYYNYVWIDGNVIEYIDFNDVSGIDYPHIGGRPVRYVYELPSYCNYVVTATYNYDQPLDPIDYRKVKDTNAYNNLNYSVYSDPVGYFGWYVKPCYTLFRENKIIIFHQNLQWPIRIEFQRKAKQLYSPYDETNIPTYYALKTIPYIAAAEILQQRWEDDRAVIESDKGYKAVVSLYAREWYKTNELQFNRRVKTVSDNPLNI